MKFQIVFTVKNGMHPFTEIVEAESIELAHIALRKMIKEAGLSLKQITSTVQL